MLTKDEVESINAHASPTVKLLCSSHEALRARVETLEQELAQKDKPVLAVGPSAVLAVWDHWRLGLQLGGFTHSDGVRFRQMVDELFEPFAVDFKRIV